MNHNRLYGEFLTNKEIFIKYIFPKIKKNIFKYTFVDFFGGEGNLILPILEYIEYNKRIEYFKNHIFLFDIQENLVEKSIKNAMKYGIPEKIARKNIMKNDSLEKYPKINSNLPIFHITNPPYLYLGHIVKNKNTEHYLKYFNGKKAGLQDLYQLAMYNDILNGIKKNIYIIPSNFLYSNSGTNKIRNLYLKNYFIKNVIIFEEKIFDFTGQHVGIIFFEKKNIIQDEIQKFEATKINGSIKKRKFELKPDYNYRGGSEFIDFCKKNENKKIKIEFYLKEKDLLENKGNNKIIGYDINNKNYKEYYVNEKTYKKIKQNFLYIRTIDTGKLDGKIGLYDIRKEYNADCIVITNGKTYRTYPIQIFIEGLDDNLDKLKKYFNNKLEEFREKYDSDFLTTFMYSENSDYIRKFIGLTYTKMLIKTFNK